jgi:multiple sugar transport system ATP-binding protein
LARVLLEDLTKAFGKLVAVNNVSLEVRDKEFVTLLGPSGCGKTTTLRMIAGLERPDSGNIYIDDTLVNELPPADRDIAMMFQSFALYPHKTVYENIAFPLRKSKMPAAELDRRVKEVGEMLHITHLLNSRPMTLSGGEKQRVALGRAIVRRPKVFLLDEPLSNLDARLRADMRAELKKLQKELGQTAILTTPDELEAMTMADRIAVIEQGRLLQFDLPETLYNDPRDLSVASFLGRPPMNLIDCTLEEEGKRALLNAGAFKRDVSDIGDLIKARATTSDLILGIRPSDVSLRKERVSEEDIEAEIYAMEPMDEETVVDLKVGDHILKAKLGRTFKTEVGAKLWMTYDRRKAHLFDRKTRQTIL